MLDYTKAAISKTLEDFKKIGYSFTVLFNIAYIGYLIYVLCANHTFFVTNIILLCISTAYLLFYLIITRFGKDLDGHKSEKKSVNNIVKWAKYGMKIYTLGTMLYSIATIQETVNGLQLILLTLQILCFILQILFTLVCYVIEKRLEMFKVALDMDWQEFKKPVTAVENFFKRVSGKEVEPKPAPTKTQIMLTERAQASKEQTKAKKAQDKTERKERKQQLREEKKAEKAAKKAAKKDKSAALPPQAEIAATDGQDQ